MGHMDDSGKSAAWGAFLGACVGDASGAVLEFLNRRPTGEEVIKFYGD